MMRNRFRTASISLAVLAFAAVGLTTVATSTATAQQACVPEFEVDFRDDFSGTEVGPGWTLYNSAGHAGNGLRRPSAITVDNGLLTITAQMIDGTLVSGGMNTNRAYTYGRFEARVRTGAPDREQATSGVLIAWPTDQPNDGPNDDGIYTELDFYETLHNKPTRSPIHGFVHYERQNNHAEPPIVYDGDATEWHDMRMDWTPSALRFYMDGNLAQTITLPAAIPDRPHAMTIQLDAFKTVMDGAVEMDVDWMQISRYNPDFDPNCGSGDNPVVNGGFESPSLSPWETYSVADRDAATRYTGNADSGTASLSHYKATPFEVDNYQKISGLADGSYELRARVKSGGGQDVARMYVLDHGAERVAYDIPTTSAWIDATLPFDVTTGQATIGFWSKGNAGNWLLIDNVTIVSTDGGGGGGSVVRVLARGTTGDEEIEVLVDGASAGTGRLSTSMRALSFTSGVSDPSSVRLRFLNDGRSGGVDRNLRVDYIEVDGTRYQTEDPSTFSTGTWDSATLCADGNKRSEWLHCSGYLDYNLGGGGGGSVVRVLARGTTGDEEIEVLVDGASAGTGRLSTSMRALSFTSGVSDPSSVRLRFLNDGRSGGVDRNLRVDYIEVDGTRYQTEDPSTFSTGTWDSATLCADGNKRSEWLHCSGYLDYDLR